MGIFHELRLFLSDRITSLSQSNLIGPPTFRRREQEWNRPFTRPIFPVWRKMVWERDYVWGWLASQLFSYRLCWYHGLIIESVESDVPHCNNAIVILTIPFVVW